MLQDTPPHGAVARLVRGAARVARRRPRTVILLWIAFIVGCTVAGSMTGTRDLTPTEAAVGESGRAAQRIDDSGLRTPATETILIRADTAAAASRVARDVQRRIADVPEVADVRSPLGDAPHARAMRTDGGRSLLVTATLRGDPDDAEEHVAPLMGAVDDARAAHRGVEVHQLGEGSTPRAFGAVAEEDMGKSHLMTLPVVLIVLIVAFGALVAASVPLILGVTAVAGGFGALGVVSQIVPNGDTTASLLGLIGLAVGVDYSLFYVRRVREERRAGRTGAEALDIAAATVGRAVLVSGVTVMVALAGLFVTGVGDFTSMAAGTMLVVGIALIGSLTVLPAVLALLGDRIDRGRLPGARRRARRAARRAERADRRGGGRPAPNGRGAGHGAWGAIARAVVRRPRTALLTAAVVLAAIAVPALGMHTADSGLAGLPDDTPAVRAQQAIDETFPGAPSHATLVVTGSDLAGADARAGLRDLGARALDVTGGGGAVDTRVADDGRTAVLEVPLPDADLDRARAAVRELRDDVAPTASRIAPGAELLVGGGTASSMDFADRMTDALPLVLGFVLGLAFLLIVTSFRSVRLALSVIALNLLSTGATYGLVTVVFQSTWAEHALGFTSTGTIASWLPLMAFVILFGLSMDYTILVLERMREARRAGASPREAAAEGVGATAGAITSAAVVMVVVFAIFITMRMVDMKQMGFALSTAILLDATIVRAVALPAAVTLLGERAFGRDRGRRDARRRPIAPETPAAGDRTGRGDRRPVGPVDPWDDGEAVSPLSPTARADVR
ncbi:MAG: MMPL family transporter [Solirubrobacteraceae bacterium]|nr:MMPL family transporter [Solirubrobacteraceae bacterium]